jgi:hypothetical protein
VVSFDPKSYIEIGLQTEHKVVRNTIIDYQKLCETMLDSIYEQGLQDKKKFARPNNTVLGPWDRLRLL